MKKWIFAVLLFGLSWMDVSAVESFPADDGIGMNDLSIVLWADGYTNYLFGTNLTDSWKTPEKALGQAVGNSYDIVGLGRGGEITLTFSQGIADGEGADFAVFENGISSTFLELAYVEVSSDGIHFVRFPNSSLTPNPVGGFGHVDPTLVDGLASRYKQGVGTPFDLSALSATSNTIASGIHEYSPEFVTDFTNNIGLLDFEHVSYVRLIDIVGDGNYSDSGGYAIYDPYPTIGSAGFDLDAVGVINRSAVSGELQTITFEPIPHQQLDFQTLELSGEADSGLPVSFSVSGPAALTNSTLYFTGTGTVEVVASQGGSAVYAPASPVLRSFRIAEQVQHIFVEPISDSVAAPGYFTVQAYSSSGLPVHLYVDSGEGVVGELNHVYVLPSSAGTVTLRASQPGDAFTAPAEDVLVEFRVLETPEDLVGFAEWEAAGDYPALAYSKSIDRFGRDALKLSYELPSVVQGTSRLLVSENLQTWTNAVPEITTQTVTNGMVETELLVPATASNQFFRVQFEGNQ
ncbi:hypothetical protein P9H32_11975 [Pontiella sp. NLcol2]|uniref:Uncharacterized protein n=2 Tax=Pontiella agarivorans TaxID=3038953 RepID=A0ABU5MYV1_9BACT|nr:hypothetical protein [Pontiella agarivorans]